MEPSAAEPDNDQGMISQKNTLNDEKINVEDKNNDVEEEEVATENKNIELNEVNGDVTGYNDNKFIGKTFLCLF